jgi:hypothetical protein
MAVWDDILGDSHRKVFEAAGWGRPAGLGRRPVLLLIDVNYNFVGDRPEPCVWDRGELTHKVNLFDLHQKYCDVLELEEALSYLDGLEPGLFDAELPVLREDGSVAS